MIDGRGFGMVMAYSFCCAPLHAVRHFAQPPQGAEIFRDRMIVSRPASPDRCCRESQRPTALGGYRAWGCQVAEKARQLGMNAKNRLRRHGHGGGSAAAFFWKLNSS